MDKGREFWIKAIGFQDDREIRISMKGGSELYGHIDLTNPGEDRWINTLVQQVNPGSNSISMRTKWLHVIEMSAYTRLKSERDAAVEALRFYANPDKWWSQLEEKGYMVIDDSDKVDHPNGFHGGKRARAVLAMIDKGEK